MADNMIELVAKLDESASIKQIQSDLDKIAPKLSLDIKISASNIKQIQSELSKAVKVQGGSNLFDTKTVKNQAKAITDAMNLKIPRGRTEEVRGKVQELIDEYKKFADIGDEISKENTFNSLVQYMEQFERETKVVNEELTQLQDVIKSIAKVKGQVVDVSKIYPDLTTIYGKNGADEALTRLFGGKKRWTDRAGEGTTEYSKIMQEINGVLNPDYVTYNLGLDGGRFSESAEGVGQLLRVLYEESENLNRAWEKTFAADAYADKLEVLRNRLNEILGLAEKVNADGSITLLDIDEYDVADKKVEKLVGELHSAEEVELFDMNDLDLGEKKVEATARAMEEVADAAKSASASLGKVPPSISGGGDTDSTIAEAKKVVGDYYGDEGTVSRISRATTDAANDLKEFVVEVELANKSTEKLTYRLNEQSGAYEFLSSTLREADHATELRSTDLSTQWETQANKLKAFANNAEKAGFASNELLEDIKNLYRLLNEANPDAGGDTNKMYEYLDALTKVKSKYQALNAEVRKDSFAETQSNKIQKLSADMAAFAQANERAVTSTKMMSTGITFADKWKQLISEMAKGAALSTDEVKHLREELGIFGKEAEAAGLKGRNAWGKFLDSFKVMSSYLSANMVFNMVKRQLREMANEVIAVDTAMTELRKVTEATDADLEKFAKSAAATGRELGASISDVINATATFARLGESLPDAEELGRVATLFKNVGDGITEEQAAEDLVSTMKAFNIEAEDSISIVDKFNEVGKLLLPKRNYIG